MINAKAMGCLEPMISFCLFLLGTLIAVAVAPADFHAKLDRFLYKRLCRQNEGSGQQEIRIVGECVLPITGRIVRILSRSGITILTITGSVFIAKGDARQIEELARQSLVKSLRLSVVQAAKE